MTEIQERIEASFEMDDEELKQELPELLDALEGELETLYEESREDLSRLMDRLDETDAAEFAEDAPDVAAQFQDFLWNVTSFVVEREEDLQGNINVDAKVNFEATDSPMTGHLKVHEEEKRIEGGSEQISDAEIHISGPTNVLSGMLTGSTDPVQGFMAGEFEMDGPVDKGMQLAQVMTPVNERLAGEDEDAEA
jgi:putative sterol carrier protein